MNTEPVTRQMEPGGINRWAVLHIINIGTLMSTLDAGIANVILPELAQSFAVSLAGIQWVVTSYLLAMVALLPAMGKWSDRSDRRKIYAGGFFVFALGSLFIALAPNLAAIIVSRCIQGAGAAMIMANSQAMVRLTFPDKERGRALGINAIVISVGTLSGPAVGGILLEYTSWPVLFLINVPLGLAAAVLGWRLFPEHPDKTRTPFDWIGTVSLAASACLLMLASVESEEGGFTTYTIALFAAGAVLLIGLFAYERTLKHGIIDRVLYTERPILVGNLTAFFMHLVQMATLIPVPFYLKQAYGLSTQSVGLILALQAVFMGAVAPFAGGFRDKYGAYVPTLAGPVLSAMGLIPVLWTGEISTVLVAVQLCLFGVGMGLFQATNNAEIMTAAPAAKAGLVGSMLALIRYLGMIAGTAAAVWFAGGMGAAAEQDPAVFAEGIRRLYLFCLLLSAVAIAVGTARPRRKIET